MKQIECARACAFAETNTRRCDVLLGPDEIRPRTRESNYRPRLITRASNFLFARTVITRLCERCVIIGRYILILDASIDSIPTGDALREHYA